ncbi:MAG: thiamine diphosphokinase [Calditrichota bacterium]
MANGDPLPRPLFKKLLPHTDRIIALDGGLENLKRWNVVPDDVVGDFDSIAKHNLTWAKQKRVTIHHRPSQEDSDFTKGMDFCREQRLNRVLVTCFTGDRLDHVLYALDYSSFASRLHIHLLTPSALLIPLRGRIAREFSIPHRHTVSWFGFPEAQHCSLEGVRWPFRNRTLRLNGFYSLSNESTETTIRLRQQQGQSLLMVGLYPTDRRNSHMK